MPYAKVVPLLLMGYCVLTPGDVVFASDDVLSRCVPDDDGAVFAKRNRFLAAANEELYSRLRADYVQVCMCHVRITCSCHVYCV